MYKKIALVAAAVFLLIGVLGFVPAFTTTDSMGMPLLLGLFMVGTLHNIIHLASGAAALAAGLTSEKASKLYFQIFGVVYLVVTIAGFLGGDTVLGVLPVNLADNFLHLFLAVAGLAIGFGHRGGAAEHTATA